MVADLSVSLAGLESGADAAWSAGPRGAIEWAAGAGFRSVALDGAAAGVRARDLDRSGRRDLAALLRRLRLGLAGIDLWIPPEHLMDPARQERALSAIVGAVELAGDLARLDAGMRPVLSVVLPEKASEVLLDSIDRAAEMGGVAVADHALTKTPGAAESLRGVGVDPGAVLLVGADPSERVLRAGTGLRGARLSDADLSGRIVPGGRGGRLDGRAYLGALVRVAYAGPITLDLRGVRDQEGAAVGARAWWEGHASFGR
jgi:sugar phosphate isomerase/epimerase